MHIILVTPAPPRSRAGNRATATRWASHLRELGHRVDIMVHYQGQPADVMIALHAWRSADAIRSFRNSYPHRPLVVAITGTDAYRFIHSHPDTTIGSIKLADRLVGLHDLIANAMPQDQQHKMHVIYQSAQPTGPRQLYQRYFHVSVLGHLRDEKDPLRPALAARLLPENSRIRIHQYGKAHSEDWAQRAELAMLDNPRYTWHREVPHHHIRQVYRRTHLLCLPSVMEGGANVISEAVVAGVPVIASDIAGSIGLLGKDYPGYYPVGDEQALARLLLRAENDPGFYQQLEHLCLQRQDLFTVERERLAWKKLLDSMAIN